MPIYEYLCENCGHEFETIQKFSDAPLRECPTCHEERLIKKISAAGFRLKGGGWYETDFKSGSKRNVAGEGASGSSGESGGAGAASESKGGSEAKSGGDSAGSGGAKAVSGD